MSHEQDNWMGIDWLYSTYMWVWAVLLILTIVEVIVPEPAIIGLSQMAQPWPTLLLILLALAKTFCVAWYYMHLIDERPAIILIACAPFIFSVFLTIGLWPHRTPHPPEDTPDQRAKDKDEQSASLLEVPEPMETIDRDGAHTLAESVRARRS